MTQMFKPESAAARYRSSMDLLTMANHKTPKGEEHGYLTATLYLSPHTSGGGPTLCPHSTEACREMCLALAGLSGLPRQLAAKQKRTSLWLDDRQGFLQILAVDIDRLMIIAEREGMKPAVRLNGTSDIIWEREAPNLFYERPEVAYYDYTKIPLHHRTPPPNYHLTFSIEGPASMSLAISYLRDGHSVAAVVPELIKDDILHYTSFRAMLRGSPTYCELVDGDAHDLRFLDPPSSVVLLKPKGHVRTELVRPRLLQELRDAARVPA